MAIGQLSRRPRVEARRIRGFGGVSTVFPPFLIPHTSQEQDRIHAMFTGITREYKIANDTYVN
jgi:hypothetical protein